MMSRTVRYFIVMVALVVPLGAVRAVSPSEPGFSGKGVPVPSGGEQKGIGGPTGEESCAATINESSGVVTLSFIDATRSGQMTNFMLDERPYAAAFDGSGLLQAKAPMFHATADLEWTGLGGADCHQRGIPFKNYRTVVFTALVWSGPYDLALHIVEPPNGRIGGPTGYVYPGRPNLDHATGLGDLQNFGRPGPDGTRVELYTLPADRNPHHGDIYYFVEFVSRGNPARSPFCGTDSKSSGTFKIIHLDSGKLEQRGGSFGSVPCGTAWNDSQKDVEYFQRWKWNL